MSASVPMRRTVHTGRRYAAGLCAISAINTAATTEAQITIMSYMSRRCSQQASALRVQRTTTPSLVYTELTSSMRRHMGSKRHSMAAPEGTGGAGSRREARSTSAAVQNAAYKDIEPWQSILGLFVLRTIAR